MKRFLPVLAPLAALLLVAQLGRAAPAAPHHMIVTAEPDATAAGLSMLRAGGSAVDAAIAAQMVLTLEEPQASGIGGGAFMMLWDGTALHAYDGREMAPASAKPTMFLDAAGKPQRHNDMVPGGLSVGVPGALSMLSMAHSAHGKLPWAKLLEPAIALAENGFKVPARLALEWGQRAGRAPLMPAAQAYFSNPDGTPLREGQTWRNPALAQALRAIAAGGPDAFYKGSIAQDIATAVSSAPINKTVMTTADLAGYIPKERTPLCGAYRAYRICSLPPSTSGGTTVLQILGLIQHFPSQQLQPGTLSALHLISEAERLAYADRDRWLGDTDFVMVPLAGLLDSGYLDSRAKLIDPMHAMGRAEAGTPSTRNGRILDYAPIDAPIENGTSHLAVVDDSGAALSMTTSVEGPFGSQLMADGFILNNQLTDFSFAPEIDGRPAANAPAPGKRPLSSMSPVIVFGPDGKFYAALGSPGGRQIIAFVAQALSNLIDGGLSMSAVSAEPRHMNQNGPTVIEQGTKLDALAPALMALGHQVRAGNFDSGVNGIRRVAGGYEGGADPRREGVALGD